MWFPRELSWEKKAPKENIKLWFPLTYLGYSCHTQRTAGNKPRMRKQQGTKSSRSGLLSDNFQWKLDTHMQPLSGLPLPAYQSPLVEETSSNPCGAPPCRRSWKQLRRSDSWTNSEPGGKSLLMRAWNMCFSPALRNSDRVPLLLAGGGGDCQRLLEEERHISYEGGKPIRFFLII